MGYTSMSCTSTKAGVTVLTRAPVSRRAVVSTSFAFILATLSAPIHRVRGSGLRKGVGFGFLFLLFLFFLVSEALSMFCCTPKLRQVTSGDSVGAGSRLASSNPLSLKNVRDPDPEARCEPSL